MAPRKFTPYGRQCIDADDIDAVVRVLGSDYLTTGPEIHKFEELLADYVGAKFAVAVSSGTAALHLALLALEIPRPRILTSPITFVASANCARMLDGEVFLCDIDPQTGSMDLNSLESALTTHAIDVVVPVHYAGHPLDLSKIAALAERHGAMVIDDACHALGATGTSPDDGSKVGDGRFARGTVFSFHPVKLITTGEGGAITTNDEAVYDRLLALRSHGIFRQPEALTDTSLAYDSDGFNPWYYEMQLLGYNYRLTDFQAALGSSQLKKLDGFLEKRRQLAQAYTRRLSRYSEIRPLRPADPNRSAWHLYVVQIDFPNLNASRGAVMRKLGDLGIGTQVHYIPVHFHPYYRKAIPGDFPVAEKFYRECLSLPIYPDMASADVDYIVDSLADVLGLAAGAA